MFVNIGDDAMAEREIGQLSFSDALRYRRAGVNERLSKIDALVDWHRIEALLAPLAPPKRGAPGYPPLLLFKAVLLAQWNGLSDEAVEEMLADRWPFQCFCGLGAAGRLPDHSTLWRFREALAKSGLGDALFAEINRQLDGHNLILRQGTLVDATLVAAQARKPPKPASEATPTLAADGRPQSLLVKSEVDPDAGWTKRGGIRFFGYKAHVGVDQGSGLIRSQRFTSADVNDTIMADELIMWDEKAVYADKAFDTHDRRARLKAAGIKDRIQHRPNKHHPLKPVQARRNLLIGKARGRVETVFGHLKRVCGFSRVRYFTKARNAASFALSCIGYNLNKAAIAR